MTSEEQNAHMFSVPLKLWWKLLADLAWYHGMTEGRAREEEGQVM